MRPISFLHLAQTIVIGLASSLATALPVRSAETIYLDYGPLGRSLPTTSLEAFAQTGTIDPALAPYLQNLSPEALQQFQRILQTPLSALGASHSESSSLTPSDLEMLSDPVVLSQWLYSPIGEIVLGTFGSLIQTEAHLSGQQSLRAAMILAASDPEGLSLINVIRFYPIRGLRVKLPQILALYRSLSNNVAATERLVNLARQGSLAAAATEPKLDYNALPVLAETGQFEVAEQSWVLKDEQRDRAYPVDLYYPEDLQAITGPIPVMVFSHGYGDTRTDADAVELAHSLAAHGFLVALPEHIGSNEAYQTELAQGLRQESFDVMEFVNRPLDIHFLLDTLEQRNDVDFEGRLQLDNVGMMGFSFGGYTALAMAGATVDIKKLEQQCILEADFTPDTANISLLIQCRILELKAVSSTENQKAIQQLTDGSLRDERVGLVAAFAPLSNLLGEQGLSNIQVPVTIVGGAYDVATPIIQEQLAAFQSLATSQKYFYLAENLSHTTELTRSILELLHPSSDMAERFDQSERWFFSLAVSILIAQGKVHLAGDKSYQLFLSAAYVEAVSTAPTKLHLLRSAPDAL